jgi:photosystem II stability/assembly factor-like uncharacterized protein
MNIWRVFVSGVICLSAASGASRWQPAGPWGGSATSIWVDASAPDTLLAGSRNSLVFRSTDGGQHWRRLPFPRHFLGTVATLAVHPADPQLYLAGLSLEQSPYAGLWYSEDAGQHWKMGRGLEGTSVLALAFWAKDPRRMVAGTRDGVWTSTDSGRSWTRISAPYNHELRGVTAVAIDPFDWNVIYAGTTHLPWKTMDGGKNWSSIHDGMIDDSDVFSIFIDPERPQRVLASACSGIYRSESAGGAWSKFQGIPSTLRRTHVIRQHPRKRDVIFAGTTLGLLKSVNGGATFKQMNQLHILSMTFDPRNPERLYLATETAGIWRSDDGGESAEPINEGFSSRRVVSVAGSKKELYANVLQDGSAGGIFASADGGRQWRLAANGAVLKGNHLTHLAVCPGDLGLVYAGNESRVLRSRDAGKSWTELTIPPGSTRVFSLACVAPQGKPAVLAGTDRGLFRGADTAAGWTAVKLTSVNIQHSVQAIFTSTAAPSRVAVRTTQAVFLSEDSGAAWRVLNILFPVSNINDLALTGGAGGPMLVATPQGLTVSEDGGKTWQRRENGLEPGTVNTLAVRPGSAGEVYAAQFGKVYRSNNSGRDWQILPQAEIEEATLRKLTFAAGAQDRLLALTPDLGVFYLDLSEQR